VKFTGGDPLLRKDILEVLQEAYRLEIPHIELITNGTKVKEAVAAREIRNLTRLTVSLDTLRAERFRSLYQRDCFDAVKEGIIQAAQTGIKVRINMVLMAFNVDELEAMIRFADSLKVELKVIELLEFQVPDRDFWVHNYIDPNEIVSTIERYGAYTASSWGEGDLGAPMRVFQTPAASKILIYESSPGTHFGSVCEGCEHYPCQDGLYGLRITHDGKLKTCWARNDNLIDLLSPLRSGDMEEVGRRLRNVLNVFANADFREGYRPRFQLSNQFSPKLHQIDRAI
jgi:cyclic pyranopterin phosphate synthase